MGTDPSFMGGVSGRVEGLSLALLSRPSTQRADRVGGTMRRTDGKSGKSYRHPNYRKHRKRNEAELRRQRRERKHATGQRHGVTLTDMRDVTPKRVSPHQRRLLEVIMKVYSTADFARKHGVSDSRIRQLIAEDRVFPRQRLDNGRYIMFANSVIVAPYERPNRKLRGAD